MNLIDQLQLVFYFTVLQFKQIFPFWISGVIAGSLLSVFAAAKIVRIVSQMEQRKFMPGLAILAAVLGAISPICMYGTIPLIAALGRKGVPQYLLAAFMVSSILINPNLFVFSFALGAPLALLRLFVTVVMGVLAGIFVYLIFRQRNLFQFEGFADTGKYNRESTLDFKVFLNDLKRGILKTAPYFLAGILLTALFDRYFPKEWIVNLFGGNKAFGVLLAASLGVPVYVCGGGTIPLLKAWLEAGMSPGSAMAFMITGPATKLTNLSAVKIILGMKSFILYIVFMFIIATVTGLAIDFVYRLVH